MSSSWIRKSCGGAFELPELFSPQLRRGSDELRSPSTGRAGCVRQLFERSPVTSLRLHCAHGWLLKPLRIKPCALETCSLPGSSLRAVVRRECWMPECPAASDPCEVEPLLQCRVEKAMVLSPPATVSNPDFSEKTPNPSPRPLQLNRKGASSELHWESSNAPCRQARLGRAGARRPQSPFKQKGFDDLSLDELLSHGTGPHPKPGRELLHALRGIRDLDASLCALNCRLRGVALRWFPWTMRTRSCGVGNLCPKSGSDGVWLPTTPRLHRSFQSSDCHMLQDESAKQVSGGFRVESSTVCL